MSGPGKSVRNVAVITSPWISVSVLLCTTTMMRSTGQTGAVLIGGREEVQAVISRKNYGVDATWLVIAKLVQGPSRAWIPL